MNLTDFHTSTSRELIAIKDRVRHLIPHWGEDGRYKEAILKSVIQRYLPTNFGIGNGFVVDFPLDAKEHSCSKQIDLIIYDTQYPILFKDGDFIIVSPDSVRAIIEVKADIENHGLAKAVKKSNITGQFIFNSRKTNTLPFFNGIFSFSGFDNVITIDPFRKALTNSFIKSSTDSTHNRFAVNHICFNKDLHYIYWDNEMMIENNHANVIYRTEDLSYSYFISNLLYYLTNELVNNKTWFPAIDKLFIVGRF